RPSDPRPDRPPDRAAGRRPPGSTRGRAPDRAADRACPSLGRAARSRPALPGARLSAVATEATGDALGRARALMKKASLRGIGADAERAGYLDLLGAEGLESTGTAQDLMTSR